MPRQRTPRSLATSAFLCLCLTWFAGAATFAADPDRTAATRSAEVQVAGVRPSTAPAISLPSMLRVRLHLTIQLLRQLAADPEVDPPVSGTLGLSDDPDPVGSKDEGEDGGDDSGGGQEQAGAAGEESVGSIKTLHGIGLGESGE